MVQFSKVPVNGNLMNFKNEIIPSMNYLFSKFFYRSKVLPEGLSNEIHPTLKFDALPS